MYNCKGQGEVPKVERVACAKMSVLLPIKGEVHGVFIEYMGVCEHNSSTLRRGSSAGPAYHGLLRRGHV